MADKIKLGIHRNKSHAFKKERDRVHKLYDKSVSDNLIGDNEGTETNTELSRRYEYIEEMFSAINREITEISRLQNDRIQGISTNDRELEAKIEAKSELISSKLKEAKSFVMQDINTPTEELRLINENFKSCYLTKVQEVTLDFRRKQARYFESMKARFLQASGHISNISGTDFDMSALDILSDQQVQQINTNREMIEMRNSQLRKFQQSINQINELLSDISTLIIAQGTILDRIDTQVMEARHEIGHGIANIKKADKHQSHKCFYIYIITIVVMIIVVGIVIISKKNKESSSS